MEEAYELATDGAVYVIGRYRNRNANLRTQLLRILKRASVPRWPKLFHNLRATRETELAGQFPIHVVCYWIGNTERIAAKHYLQVTDADFAHATLGAPGQTAQNTAHEVPKTAQNEAQHRARTEHARNEKTPESPGFSADSPVFSAVDGYPQGDSNKARGTLGIV